MKKLLAALMFMAGMSQAWGQATVTATITDPDSIAWASLNNYNATYTITLVSSSGASVTQGRAFVSATGATVQVSNSGNLSSSGAFSVSLFPNAQITPANTSWKFQVCPAVSVPVCATYIAPVTGSGDISAAISAVTLPQRIGFGSPGAYAYADVEAAAVANNTYLNITTPASRCYTTSWVTCGGGGGGGSPGGSTTQAQYNNAGAFAGAPGLTFGTGGSVAQLANARYLSCTSELGAQVSSAVTSLGTAGGTIVFPNCTTATWTTAVTGVPASISFKGYGTRASQITCSVAGTCLTIHEPVDWASTSISIGSDISGFTMLGSATTASNQTLISGEGLNGFTIHDVAFNGTDSSHEPTCFEFHNTSTDQTFTEREVTYNMQFGQQCKTSVLFQQDSSDGNNSFGYNQFEFSVAPTGPNYGIVFNGNANLYGGSLTVLGNYVGTGGGILQFNGGFSTGSPPGGGPLENLFVSVENNSNDTTAHIIGVTNSASNLQFSGDVWAGSPGAFGWTTPIYNPSSAFIAVSQVNQYGFLSIGSASYNPSGNIGTFISAWPYGTNLALKNTTTGGQEWDLLSEGSGGFPGAFAFSNTTSHPLLIWDNNSNAPQIETLSNGGYCWSTTTTGGISNSNVNNCLTSPGSGVISMDTTTPGNHAATVNAHAYQIDGVPFTGGGGALTLISTQTLAATATSVTFSSIPQTYNDLELVLRKCTSDNAGTLQAQFNGDTTTGDYYVNTVTMSFSSSQTPFGSFNSNNASIGSLNTNLGSSDTKLLGYASTSTLKPYTFSSVGQNYQTGGGLWNSNSAITSIVLSNSAGGNFHVGCSFSLYGVS